jgi:hypothetical protein
MVLRSKVLRNVVLGLHGGRGKNPVSVQTQKTLWILRQISQRQNQLFSPHPWRCHIGFAQPESVPKIGKWF